MIGMEGEKRLKRLRSVSSSSWLYQVLVSVPCVCAGCADRAIMMILNSIEFLRDFAVESLPMRKQVLRQTNTL